MPSNGPLHGDGSDAWKYAVGGGAASLPFTTAVYWETGSELSLSPVLFGGLLAGFLAGRRTGTSRGVGVRAGLIGGLPVLWMLYDVLTAASGLSGASWFVAGGLALTVLFAATVAVIAFGLAAVLGGVGGRIGGWIAGPGGPQSPASGD